MKMTSLIDTIEDAFRDAVTDAEGGLVVTTRVVEAIEMYTKASDVRGDIERIVDGAYFDAAATWGEPDWRHQTGEVAERVVDGLRDWVTGPGAGVVR
jgi:hypothetical protein